MPEGYVCVAAGMLCVRTAILALLFGVHRLGGYQSTNSIFLLVNTGARLLESVGLFNPWISPPVMYEESRR